MLFTHNPSEGFDALSASFTGSPHDDSWVDYDYEKAVEQRRELRESFDENRADELRHDAIDLGYKPR
jgi:hypothetical protein